MGDRHIAKVELKNTWGSFEIVTETHTQLLNQLEREFAKHGWNREDCIITWAIEFGQKEGKN